MATKQIVTDAAPTVYAAYTFRNRLLSSYDTQECAGAPTFLITVCAALQSRAAHLAAQPHPAASAAGFAPIARVAMLAAALHYARAVAPADARARAVEKARGWVPEQERKKHGLIPAQEDDVPYTLERFDDELKRLCRALGLPRRAHSAG